MRKTIGRPKLSKANRHSGRVVVHLQPAQHKELKRFAAQRGVPIAVAGREIIEAALRRGDSRGVRK